MHRIIAFALLAAAAASSPALAQTGGRFAVGAQAGTTGVGAEAQFQATPRLTLRAGGDVFKYDDEYEGGRFRYDGEADFSTVSAFVDLHPFANPFFVSGGGYFGSRTVAVAARPTGPVTIDGFTFTPDQFGTLRGEADFGEAAPFAGLGWNNTFRTAGPLGFKVLVGATFGSEPEASLRREGGTGLSPAAQAVLEADRQREERELEEDLKDFRILPVAQVGVTFRF
jgi:hypothetical protein